MGRNVKIHCFLIILIEDVTRNFRLVFYYIPTLFSKLIIIMVIFKCYLSGEHIALSIKKNNNNSVNIEL